MSYHYEFEHDMSLIDQMGGMFNRIADRIEASPELSNVLPFVRTFYKDGHIQIDSENELSDEQQKAIEQAITPEGNLS